MDYKVEKWDMRELYTNQNIIDQDYHNRARMKRGETFKKRKLSLLVEVFELINECRTLFKYWSNKGDSSREVILEEYADGLHFILSLGNDLSVNPESEIILYMEDPLDHIDELSGAISNIRGVMTYQKALAWFRGFGEYHLDFTKEEIEEAYYAKTRYNILRIDHNNSKALDGGMD